MIGIKQKYMQYWHANIQFISILNYYNLNDNGVIKMKAQKILFEKFGKTGECPLLDPLLDYVKNVLI